jgi:hypothetical protein
MHALSDGGMSAMVTWQASARELRAEAPDVQVVDVDHALDGFHAGANLRQRAPRGVPSSRMLSVSRTMPMLDQRMSAAMSSERTGSIQFGR